MPGKAKLMSFRWLAEHSLRRAPYGFKGRQRMRGQARFSRRRIDEHFMRRALAIASASIEHGEVPVGAVLVRRGRIIARSANRIERGRDALNHAEMLCLHQGSRVTGRRMTDCTLYVTLEPCAMCAGAIVNSRLHRLVYGASDPLRGGCGSMMDIIGHPDHLHHVMCSGGVLEAACAEQLRDFFKHRRDENRMRRAIR